MFRPQPLYKHIGLDNDQAFAWLDKGYEEQSAIMQWLKVEPTFDPLRRDPRFTELMRRIGLQDETGQLGR